MMDVDNSCLHADSKPKSVSWLAWSVARQPLGAILHSSDELRELSKLLVSYHSYDSTINIVTSYY